MSPNAGADGMPGGLPEDFNRQCGLLVSLGADELLGEGSWGPCLRVALCCIAHPDWQVQTLGTVQPAGETVFRVRGANVFVDHCLPWVRRAVERTSGAYVEERVEQGPDRRRSFAPSGGMNLQTLERFSRHVLDQEPWRPRGGAPKSRKTQKELATTILRLTAANLRVPRQADVAAEPGYPPVRGLREVLRLDEFGSLPWRSIYVAAASRAHLLEDWEGADALDLATPDDSAYLDLGQAARAKVTGMLRHAGGAGTRPSQNTGLPHEADQVLDRAMIEEMLRQTARGIKPG